MTQYVLLKRDLFDCPKHMGYTGIRDKAGVYLEWEVKAYEIPIRETYCPRDHDLYGLPLSEAPEFTRACFADLARDHLRGKIEEARQENAELRSAFDVLNKNVGYELTWGEVDGWEDDCRWRVHRRNGGRNDTQWTLVATGETAQSALLAARDYIQSVIA